MKHLAGFGLLLLIANTSCNYMWRETIHGNGKLTTEQRNAGNTERIKSMGFFDVDITPGSSSVVAVEADENLQPYIVIEDRNGTLVIRTKENVNLESPNKIKVHITTPRLEEAELEGSGNIMGKGKFTGADHLKLGIAGSGNISMEVNSPKVNANIAGSGNITIAGETQDAKIEIAGVGDYKAEDLKAENVEVHIAGSGNVRVFADATLKVDIAGSGDVYYKGNASVSQNVAGSGKIKQIQ